MEKILIFFCFIPEYIILTNNMNRSTSVVLGRNIVIMCGVKTISGIEITFQWSKYNVPVVENTRVRMTRTERSDRLSYTSDMRGYLKITGAQYTDAGFYTCQIEGNKKTIAFKNVLLKVKGKQVIYRVMLLLINILAPLCMVVNPATLLCTPNSPPPPSNISTNRTK